LLLSHAYIPKYQSMSQAGERTIWAAWEQVDVENGCPGDRFRWVSRDGYGSQKSETWIPIGSGNGNDTDIHHPQTL
jgi:hypothetical protein